MARNLSPDEEAKITEQHDADFRMLAYAVDQYFSGDISEGKKFCRQLFCDDMEVERKFELVTQYDRPVLDCVMNRMTNIPTNQRADLASLLKNELPNLPEKPNPLNIKDGQDEFLRERSKRIRIFERISHEACEEWRLISHFLLDYAVIQTISANHPNNVKVKLRKILEKWQVSTDPEKGTWLHLKSLLIFLNKHNLVSKIDEEELKGLQSEQGMVLFSHSKQSIVFLADHNQQEGTRPEGQRFQ